MVRLPETALPVCAWQRLLFIIVCTASLVIVSSCQAQVDEPIASSPVPTEAAISATTAQASTTTPDDVEAPTASTPTAVASTTAPAVSATTRVEPQVAAEAQESDEAEDAAEPEADPSDAVSESAELETDASHEADDAADKPAPLAEPSDELLPLCHELEFGSDDAAEYEPIGSLSYPPHTVSNEDYEVVVTFDPSPTLAAAAAHDRDGHWRVRPEAYEPQTVIVEITEASGGTTRHQLPLDPPEALPHHLYYAVMPEALAIGPRGWMLAMSGVTYLVTREHIPRDFDKRGPSIGGVSDRNWLGSEHDADGLYIYLLSAGYTPDGNRHKECFVSFESLGIPGIDWVRHGSRSPKGSLSPDEYRGVIWTSEWSGSPVRSDLPSDSGRCCELFALDTGFALTTSSVPGGYWAEQYWPKKLFHTSDGAHWQQVTLPLFDDGSDRDCTTWNDMDCTIWICHVDTAGSMVRILEGLDLGPQGPGPCEETHEWIADPDFTNWRLLEPEE